MLTYILTQVARNEQLLVMARDYLHFVTKFFEVINVSATHIYHSALELSPSSSVVRKSYYNQHLASLPRVVAGTPDSWDQSVTYTRINGIYRSSAWSPCGQFIAVQNFKAVEIRDPLTFELLSTLTESGICPLNGLAYSPDGYSLATVSINAVIIWDIQTGGIVKKIRCQADPSASPLWSLDGRMIAILVGNRFKLDQNQEASYYVFMYDVTLGTSHPPSKVQSRGRPHVWAYDTSFQIVVYDGKAFTIFNAGSVLTKVKSFPIQTQGDIEIMSFSPTTYHLSIWDCDYFVILDIQNSKYLLRERGVFFGHCFSSDGCLLAAYSRKPYTLHIWANNFGHYSSIGQFACISPSVPSSLSFSPSSSSILGHFGSSLQVWSLDDGHPVLPPYCQSFTAISYDGTYIATTLDGDNTVTIADPLSHPLCHINVDMEIHGLALVGNILLVVSFGTVVAWCLTGGTVAGAVVAGLLDSIWSVSPPGYPVSRILSAVKGEIGVISSAILGIAPHIYHTGTGEVLQPDQAPPFSSCSWYELTGTYEGQHYHRYHSLPAGDGCLDSWTLLPDPYWVNGCRWEGWVKDPKGEYRLWVPFEWRKYTEGHWFYEITTLQLKLSSKNIFIMF